MPHFNRSSVTVMLLYCRYLCHYFLNNLCFPSISMQFINNLHSLWRTFLVTSSLLLLPLYRGRAEELTADGKVSLHVTAIKTYCPVPLFTCTSCFSCTCFQVGSVTVVCSSPLVPADWCVFFYWFPLQKYAILFLLPQMVLLPTL